MLLPSGNPIICHEGLLSLQLMFPPKALKTFPSDGVDAQNHRGLDAFRFVLNNIRRIVLATITEETINR